MNFYTYRYMLWHGGSQSATADAAINYTEHDKRYHHGNFDPKTMTCEMREAEAKGDLVDVLNAEEDEKEYLRKKRKETSDNKKAKKEAADAERASEVVRKTIAELKSQSFSEADIQMVDAAVHHVLSAKPVVVSIEEAQKDARFLRKHKAKDVKENMSEYFTQKYPNGIYVPRIGSVELNKASVKSLIAHAPHHNMTLPALASICHLDEIARSAVQFSYAHRWKDRADDSICLAAPLRLGDQDKVVELTIIRNTLGRQELYNVKVIDKKAVEEGARLDAATRTTGEKVTSSTTAHSIPDSSAEVNHHITEKQEISEPPKIPASNLVKQYLAAHGLLGQFLQE